MIAGIAGSSPDCSRPPSALLSIHSSGRDYWAGGTSFSSRFLTALFPFFLIGAAEFVRRTRWIGMALLAACVAWSVWLGLVMLNGYDNESSRDGVDTIVGVYYGPGDGLDAFSHEIRVRAQDRWARSGGRSAGGLAVTRAADALTRGTTNAMLAIRSA